MRSEETGLSYFRQEYISKENRSEALLLACFALEHSNEFRRVDEGGVQRCSFVVHAQLCSDVLQQGLPLIALALSVGEKEGLFARLIRARHG